MLARSSRCLLTGLVLSCAPMQSASAQEGVALAPGAVLILRTDRVVKTIVIGVPEVADAAVATARTVVVTGKAAGRTEIVLLDESGDEIMHKDVRVGPKTVSMRELGARGEVTTYECDRSCSAVPPKGPVSMGVEAMRSPTPEGDKAASSKAGESQAAGRS
jgi:hypothetical protein